MNNIDQKAKKFKRGVIKQLTPFFKSGLLTAKELEFIAQGTVVANLDVIKDMQ